MYKENMKIKEIIRESIKRNLGDDSFGIEFSVEHPSEEVVGDYASNVAMVKYRQLAVATDSHVPGGKNEGIIMARGTDFFNNPRELAETIVEKLKNDKDLGAVVNTENIQVAGPGFINFWIKDEFLKLFAEVKEAEVEKSLKGKKVLVEYSSPNIAKRFSVGHLRSTIIGNAIERIYKYLGATVTNDNHLGDWGTQFGMIIAAVEEKKLEVTKMSVADLETEYVEFNKRIAEDPALKDKAREAFARLEAGDTSAREIWQASVDVSMKEFEKIYERLDVHFEHNYGESVYEKDMPAIIEEAKQKGIAVEGEKGAWIVKFEKDGTEYMPPAMLVKGDGTTTYFTRDLATIKWRLMKDEIKADLYVYEVGGEQRLHLRQVFETAKMLWEEARKVEFVHVPHGMMTLPEGKMSTRKGNTIKLEDLLERAGEEAKEYGGNKDVDAQQMGLNAVKYNELRRSPAADYVFRWEEALSMEGNSAPYINYAYVRAKKILSGKDVGSFEGVFEGEEKDLARFLMRFGEGEIVEEAAKNFAPQQICTYLFELAKRFNAFYDHNRVIGDERENARLALVDKVARTIRDGMGLLGILVVEEM